jgi:ribosomal-protein-alanine N-acetyltransferase
MMIRRATLSDAIALRRLEEQLFSEADYPLSLRAFRYHIPRSLLLVAETEGTIVGYALALVRGRRAAKLYSIGVVPQMRGRGTAAALLRQLLEELGALGFARVVLEVRTGNENAIVLYRRFGFEVTKRLASFYRDGCDAYLMERSDASATLSGTL